MARPLRVEFPGAVYHVTARGNERRMVFHNDKDRQAWLEEAAEMVSGFGVRVHGYCVMGNHFHLILETPNGNLSAAVGWLQATFTTRYNRRRRRSGHLFQGRYKAQVVEADEYAQELLRYIHLNPVRIGVKKGEPIPAESAAELDAWKWSSHRAYLGSHAVPDWLSLEWMEYFGSNRREARRRYRQFIRDSFRKGIDSPFDSVRGGLVLGGERLWNQVGKLLEERSAKEEKRWVTREMDQIQARAWVRETMLQEPDPRIRIWMMVNLGQWPRVEVGREFGYRDGSAITHILNRLKTGGPKVEEAMAAWEAKRLSSFKR